MKRMIPWLIVVWSLLVAIARTIRMPNDFAEAHWILDYRFGFIKRGLIGWLTSSALAVFGLQMTPGIIATLSAVVYACFIACMLLVIHRIFRHAPARDDALLLALVFVSSPFVVMSAHVFGYFDALIYSLTIAAVWLMLANRPWLSAAVSSFAMFTHEGYLAIGLPLVCLASLATHLRNGIRRPRLNHVAAIVIPMIVFVAVPIMQHVLVDHAQIKKDLRQYLDDSGFISIRISRGVSRSHTYSFVEATMLQGENVVERIFDPTILACVAPPLLAILYYLHSVFSIRPFNALSLLLLAVIAAPLSMHLVACDTARLSTFTIAGAFIATWILAETRRASPPHMLFALVVIPAFILNIMGRIPLMDQQVERIPNPVLLLLYAPVLFVMFRTAIYHRSPRFFADFSGAWPLQSHADSHQQLPE